MDSEGNLDLSQKDLMSLDLVIASMHTPCMRPGSKAENTYATRKCWRTLR